MNAALIIAGGTGHRMRQDIPKQFLNVYDKPVIIYTLESFQRHPEIDVRLFAWRAGLRFCGPTQSNSKLINSGW